LFLTRPAIAIRTVTMLPTETNVWTFVLDEQDGRTRLISRNRFRLPTLTAKIGMVPTEPASLVMERKMLRGIKRRAERLAEEDETRV
jgi:hypothetical protein